MKRLIYIFFIAGSLIAIPVGIYSNSSPLEYIPNFIYIIFGFLTLKLHKKLEMRILMFGMIMFGWAIYDLALTDAIIWGLVVITYLIDQKNNILKMFNLIKPVKSHTKIKSNMDFVSKIKLNAQHITTVVLVLAILTLTYSIGKANYLEALQHNQLSTPTPTTMTTTNSPNSDPTPNPTVHRLTQPTPNPTNTDGKIDCTIHANCGGSSIRLTKAECDQTTCCQISKTWSFYRDKNKCKEDQQNSMPKANPSITNTQIQYPPCTVFYPILGYSQTYNYMTTESCNIAKSNASNFLATPSTTTTNIQPSSSTLVSCNGVTNTYFGELPFIECCTKICNEGYEIEKQNIQNQYGSSTGTGEFIIKTQVEPEYQSCLATCN